MKRVVSLVPILNVVQLMMARSLVWLTITEAVPWPWTVADPPTTLAPSGPAAPGSEPSVSSAVVVSKSLWMRGDMRGPLISSGQDEEVPPVVTRSGHGLGNRKVGRN